MLKGEGICLLQKKIEREDLLGIGSLFIAILHKMTPETSVDTAPTASGGLTQMSLEAGSCFRIELSSENVLFSLELKGVDDTLLQAFHETHFGFFLCFFFHFSLDRCFSLECSVLKGKWPKGYGRI